MKKEYVIAFDQGTTSTRSILFDKQGHIIAIAQKELTQHYPQSGWVEHDPMEIFEDQRSTFEEIMAKSGISPQEIVGIGITNQRETTVVWDKKTGEPIHNAIVWLDRRSQDICEVLKESGLESYVRENTGLVIDAYFSGTKLRWILDHVPGAQQKAEAGELMFGTVDSWLIYKFSGGKRHVTDHTNASRTMLYNIREFQWDKTLLQALNIPESILPRVQSSASEFGSVVHQGIEIPILGVAGDQQSALFGQGGYNEGIAKNTYGTGCFLLLNTGETHHISKNGLLTTLGCSLEGEPISYVLEGSIFIGGAAVQWLRDQLDIIESAGETEAICESIPPLEDVVIVPAFAGLGAPYWDANAKGAIFGITLDTGRKELIKATVDALAYQTRDVLKAMTEDSGISLLSLKVDGGASANNYLMQFQADILGVAVDRPKMLEVTALGAAMLAGIRGGLWSLEDIEKVRDADRIFQPGMDVTTREEKYGKWLAAVERTKSEQAKG